MSRPTGFSLVVRALVRDRAKDFNAEWATCEIMATCQGVAAEAAHHRRPRGAGGSRRLETNQAANALATCSRCHEYVESNRDTARRYGWLLLQSETPSEVPVLRRGKWVSTKEWLMTDSSAPHVGGTICTFRDFPGLVTTCKCGGRTTVDMGVVTRQCDHIAIRFCDDGTDA